jgi:hypothetical protein
MYRKTDLCRDESGDAMRTWADLHFLIDNQLLANTHNQQLVARVRIALLVVRTNKKAFRSLAQS